jgi:hypothetical protein
LREGNGCLLRHYHPVSLGAARGHAVINGFWARGSDCGSTNPRSLDEFIPASDAMAKERSSDSLVIEAGLSQILRLSGGGNSSPKCYQDLLHCICRLMADFVAKVFDGLPFAALSDAAPAVKSKSVLPNSSRVAAVRGSTYSAARSWYATGRRAAERSISGLRRNSCAADAALTFGPQLNARKHGGSHSGVRFAAGGIGRAEAIRSTCRRCGAGPLQRRICAKASPAPS